MDLLQLLTLGFVQGVTEWIPVSSKTQVTFAYLTLFHGDPALVIPILMYVHLGTVIAASLYFRNELAGILREFKGNSFDLRHLADGKTGFLFVALLFTGVLGVPLLVMERKIFPALNGSALYVVMGAGLFVTGFLLLSHKRRNLRKIQTVSWRDGIITGILQGLSVLPGISRSGTSTTGLIWRGFDGESSFYLSFFLSIPTVILAEIILMYGIDGIRGLPIEEGLILLMTSLIAGYFTLDGLLKIVQRVNIAYLVFVLGTFIMIIGISGIG